MKKLLLVSVAFLALVPATAFARGRVRVFVGPAFVPYSWYGWGPYYGMYPYGPYFPSYAAPNTGQVKLDTNVKDANVYIDGTFAGTVGELKTMNLRPGSYDIEVRAPGRTPFEQQIYVLAGKTIKLHPDLQAQAPTGPAGS